MNNVFSITICYYCYYYYCMNNVFSIIICYLICFICVSLQGLLLISFYSSLIAYCYYCRICSSPHLGSNSGHYPLTQMHYRKDQGGQLERLLACSCTQACDTIYNKYIFAFCCCLLSTIFQGININVS